MHPLTTVTMITLVPNHILTNSASLYKCNSRKSVVKWNKPLFSYRRSSFQKVLANANKAIEKSTKFINKIKSRELVCTNRAKSIPKNATIRKEYINCGKLTISDTLIYFIFGQLSLSVRLFTANYSN